MYAKSVDVLSACASVIGGKAAPELVDNLLSKAQYLNSIKCAHAEPQSVLANQSMHHGEGGGGLTRS